MATITPVKHPRPLRERDLDVLDMLSGVEWVRPMDLGGYDASWHTVSLHKMVGHGLVERREYGSSRSFKYRITDAGRVALRGKP